MEQQPQYGKEFTEFLSRHAKSKAARFGAKLVKVVYKKLLHNAIKAILVKTAPIWVSVLFILFFAYIAFSIIFGISNTVMDDEKATSEDIVGAFFGFSKEDMKGYEDIMDTYKEVAARWDDGLDDFQLPQVQMYEFSWGVLAGVDRMRNDPYIKRGLDSARSSYSATTPPAQFISIYQSAGQKYGIDWSVLAAIHYRESTYSTFPVGDTSSAGAKGPMQFMPSTWSKYGVDGDGDGKADISSTIDAIYGAANYLSASGYLSNPVNAIYAYNHANWYVTTILNSAKAIKSNIEGNESENTVQPVVAEKNDRSNILITPKPEDTFSVLRPKFDWKDSYIKSVCTTCDKSGCSTTEEEKDVKLITTAKTYEGTYEHRYNWETITTHERTENSSTTCTITREKNIEVIPPSEEEFMKPFYDYLAKEGIDKTLDIDTTLELIAVYDDVYLKGKGIRDSINPMYYPQITGSNGWIWVTPSKRITSGFGPRVKPCASCSGYHAAIDIGAVQPGKDGDPVYAMTDGKVIESNNATCSGNTIKIDHGDGVITRYIHLQRRFVRNGEIVRVGQLIGTMGNTGSCSQGAHLDFKLTINGQPVDPRYYFTSVAFN